MSVVGSPLASAQSPDDVRALLDARIGGVSQLMVPESDETMPAPDDPRFEITQEKKHLGKLLFFDPVRMMAIRPELGGNRALAQTASCGSCHIGVAASKSGQQISFAMGGIGMGEMTDEGFVGTRTIIPGLTDILPTAFEIFDSEFNMVDSGRFDAVDSPGRTAPSVIGFAFNNRMFLDGGSGEPYDPDNPDKANLNKNDLPAGENTAEFTFKAHRMFQAQQFAVQKIPAYVEMFRRAFPDEAAVYRASGNLDDLINDDTIGRAIAAFMRTVITRETPYDRFLAGDDDALTDAQRRGMYLFFQAADQGGADCVSCHSGPALNKQLGDEAGLLVDENFHNLGTGDHPNFEMIRRYLDDPSVHDVGRQGVTADAADAFKFRTPTLRQTRDGAPYMHGGNFETLREVVEYFNAGDPRSPEAVAAGTVSPRFTNPRGEGTVGLGLSDADIDALVDFLANGLFDRNFVTYNARSRTDTFELNQRDMSYDLLLTMLGATSGRVPSGMTHPQTDDQTAADLVAIRRATDPPLCGSMDLLGLAMAGFAPLVLVRRMRRRRSA